MGNIELIGAMHYSYQFSLWLCVINITVATPLCDKCEGEAHTPKSGELESPGTPENSELDFRGQISSH
jgi:hypothetical protein